MLGRLAAVVLLLGAAGWGGWFYAARQFDAPGPLEAPRATLVPRGGMDQTGQALAEAGVIAQPLPFRLFAFLTQRGGALHAGEFAFPARASLREVLAVLRTARPVQHHLTIPEGLTAKQAMALLDRADAVSGDAPAFAEGELLPETYTYEYGATRASLVDRARAAMDRALREGWNGRAPDLPLAAPRDALILASIVERETARAEERPHVAAVFLNRLRLGMKLQSDPTVAFAASNGTGSLDRPLGRADLDRDDPFNTYRIRGLPPAPICSPGLASLRAATQPARSDDLYFVADGSGGHVFSHTLEEHTRNVARWRAGNAPPSEMH